MITQCFLGTCSMASVPGRSFGVWATEMVPGGSRSRTHNHRRYSSGRVVTYAITPSCLAAFYSVTSRNQHASEAWS